MDAVIATARAQQLMHAILLKKRSATGNIVGHTRISHNINAHETFEVMNHPWIEQKYII